MAPSVVSSASEPTITPPVGRVNSPPTLLSVESPRVKCVDIHETEPWLLCALYDGTVTIHDVATKQLVKTFRIGESPVRTARFISRENWIVVGSDDHRVRVLDLATNQIHADFVAHDDYVRGLAVHASLPLVFSCGDDKTVKVWDWSRGWECVQVAIGHDHYVMAITANAQQLASASLDHSVRLWSIGATDNDAVVTATRTVQQHNRGVNAVAINAAACLLATASDDCTVSLYDVSTDTSVGVLHGHTDNVSSVAFHPSLPLVVSGSEDDSVRVWNYETQRCEAVWTLGLGRVWSIHIAADGKVAMGFDRGTAVTQIPPVETSQESVDGVITLGDRATN